jgi:UDP-N-acetylglucosamine 2-epimerase (non-hydrolysing)
LTLHRPSNVDDEKTLAGIVSALNEIARELPIFFPVHPRTRKMLGSFGMELSENIHTLSPLSFRESLFLWKDAMVVLTDSGGLQEETTALGVPCLTIRENTERPITIEQGTNVLCGCSKDSILHAFEDAISNRSRKYQVPPKWDGLASKRIWHVITDNRQI